MGSDLAFCIAETNISITPWQSDKFDQALRLDFNVFDNVLVADFD